MSAEIANSFIFRESYFAEEVLQYQTPSCIDEDEDDNAASSIDYIRKYVEQLTADVRVQFSSSPATTTIPASALNAGSTLLPPSSSSSASPSAMATATTTPSTVSSAATAAHAAIIAFNFASIQVSPSSNSASTILTNNDASASSLTTQHEDNARLEYDELDLPRYLSWFDEDALASDSSDDEEEQDDDGEEEHQVIFY